METSGHTDFEPLLQRARDGDDVAMQQLVDQYEPEVRLVARLQLGAAMRPHMDSIDLVQSVHRMLITGLREGKHDISTPENLVALAVTMVRRKVVDHWRHLKRQQRLSRGGTCKESTADLLLTLHGGGDDQQQRVELEESVERLMGELNELERQLIELRLLGYSTAEASRELDLDPDVARVRLSRLRSRIQSLGITPESI